MVSTIQINSHRFSSPEPTPYTEGRIDMINVSMTGNAQFYPQAIWYTEGGSYNPIHLYNENIDVTGGYALYHGPNASSSKPTVTADSVYSAADRTSYQTTPTFTLQDIGNNSSTKGTSQYVPGTYPVPATNRREVGTGKTYSTVVAAYQAADDGDNIVIFPGTYNCDAFAGGAGNNIIKNVRFYGSTENHADVTLTGSIGVSWWFQWYPYWMTQLTTERPGMYHLSLSRNLYNWRHNITIHSTLPP